MARKLQAAPIQEDDNESLVRVFFRGFFWPVRMIGRGLAWMGHRPPLKQTGHALRWFFRLKPVRFLARITGLRFMASSWRELRFVTWPTKREGVRLTTAVIIFAVVFAAIMAAVDYGLDKAFKQILLK